MGTRREFTVLTFPHRFLEWVIQTMTSVPPYEMPLNVNYCSSSVAPSKSDEMVIADMWRLVPGLNASQTEILPTSNIGHYFTEGFSTHFCLCFWITHKNLLHKRKDAKSTVEMSVGICLLFCCWFWFLKTGFLCVALAVPELTL